MARATIRHLIDLGVDYIKIDFLSHGSVEGAHYRPEFTGRMALNYAYSVLSEEIDRAGREIFVSLSIAPLFPTFPWVTPAVVAVMLRPPSKMCDMC